MVNKVRKKIGRPKEYPDIDLNQIIYCKCGCGGRIKLRKEHKYWGIPQYCCSGHSSKGKKRMSPFSEEHRRKLSQAKEGKKQSKTTVLKRITKIIGVPRPESVKMKISESNKGKKRSEETKQKLSESHIGKSLGEKNSNFGKTQTIKAKKKQSETMQVKWLTPDYVKKQMKSRGVQPNKPELQLQSLLNELYPNEFKYVGDGDVIIAGKCPDFINVNGKKQIIELYGDYWHRNDNPEDRIKIFEPYGYTTLVIWEKELKNVDSIKYKIKEFNNGSSTTIATSSEVKPSREGEL